MNLSNTTTTDTPGVYHRSVHAGKWVIMSNIAQRILSLVTFLILARLLTPEDYGLIAIVFVVTGFFDTFTTPGFEKALMQRQSEANEYLDIIWTFNLIKSFLIAAAIFFAAPLLAKFFNAESAIFLLRAGAIFVFIPALSNSKQFYFIRDLDFKKIFWRDVVSQMVYIVAAFSWVFLVGRNVWALFAGHVARFCAAVIITYILRPHRPRLSFDFKKLKNLTGYGAWVTGQNVLDYFLGMLDSLYIGRLLNAEQLGYYTKARDLAFVPVSPFFTIIDKVGFAAYAKVQSEKAKIREGFLRTFDVLMSISVPVFLVLATEGGTVVDILLGKKWLTMVMPLKILASATILSSLVSITKPIFDAIGRPDINVKSHVIQFVLLLGLIYVGVKNYGLIGVAVALVISWLVVLAFVIWRARPVLQLGWSSFRDSFIALFVSNGAVALILVPYRLFAQGKLNNELIDLGVMVISGIVYLLLHYLVGRKLERGPWKTFETVRASLLPK